ncbi:MAG: PGF-pre-PGF domain-containing protein [Candidatus Nanoarchaeia archaeon]
MKKTKAFLLTMIIVLITLLAGLFAANQRIPVGAVFGTPTAPFECIWASKYDETALPGYPIKLFYYHECTLLNEVSIEVSAPVTGAKVKTFGNVTLTAAEGTPSGTILGAFRFEHNIPTTKLAKIILQFKVPQTELAAKGFRTNEVQLSTFTTNGWIGLETKVVAEDSNFVYFESSATTLDLFAVVATTTQAIPPPSSIIVPPPTPQLQTAMPIVLPAVPLVPLALAILLMLIIVVLVYRYQQYAPVRKTVPSLPKAPILKFTKLTPITMPDMPVLPPFTEKYVTNPELVRLQAMLRKIREEIVKEEKAKREIKIIKTKKEAEIAQPSKLQTKKAKKAKIDKAKLSKALKEVEEKLRSEK